VFLPEEQSRSGSGDDGLERSKLLRKMKVQVTDVQAQEEFGKFALTNEIQGYQKHKKSRRFI